MGERERKNVRVTNGEQKIAKEQGERRQNSSKKAQSREEGEAERAPEFGIWAPPRNELPCPEMGLKGRGQSSAGPSVNWISGCLSRDAGSSLEFRRESTGG